MGATLRMMLSTLLRLIARRMGQGLLMVEHRVEIALVEPAFEEVKLNRGRPMASAPNRKSHPQFDNGDAHDNIN
jgi:hypothetical protein